MKNKIKKKKKNKIKKKRKKKKKGRKIERTQGIYVVENMVQS